MLSHPRDARITFDPGPHTYLVDGVEYTSVTTVISHFFPKFDSERIARNCAGKGKYQGMSAEEVEARWKKNADESADKGTLFHQTVEDFLSQGTLSENPDFLAWRRWYETAGAKMGKPARLEWTIFDEEYRVAGTLDALFQSPKGPYFLMDWKRKRHMARQPYRPGDNGLGPLTHIPNCDFAKAALQLNTYRWMLARRYDVRVKAMGLVQVHPDSGLNTHRVGFLEDDVSLMLNAWKNRDIR
ncbi:MAG: hypothetical protein QNK37_07220 [Acidobacteriota bacterium]|nr:hypothetical protein [Acidobacteriota bacterium]